MFDLNVNSKVCINMKTTTPFIRSSVRINVQLNQSNKELNKIVFIIVQNMWSMVKSQAEQCKVKFTNKTAFI